MKQMLLALVAALTVAACDDHGKALPPLNPPDLPVEAVGAAAGASEQVFDGSLEAVNQASVSAQTSGRIIELPFDVNQQVRVGDVVARLRDTEQRARLDQAEANLRAAQAQMTESDKAFQRIQDVFQRKLVAAAQMDRATADHDAARAQLAAAQAAHDQAAEQMDYTVVRAPYAGVVTERPAQVGDAVMPGQPLLTIQGNGDVRAVVDVSELQAAAIRLNPRARLIFADGSSVPGAAVTVFPNADPATHTFRVRVNLPGTAAAINHAGQLVKVAFALGQAQGLAVPASEIAWRGEVAGVYVIDGARLEFRAIRPGRPLADGCVEVLAGLRAGDEVVTQPNLAAAALDQTGGAH